MTVTRKKIAAILKHWNLENADVSDFYHPSTGAQIHTAYSIGQDYVMKFSTDLAKLQNHMTLSNAIAAEGLSAALPVPTSDGQAFIQDAGIFYCLTQRVPGLPLISDDFYGDQHTPNAYHVGEVIGRLHLVLRRIECSVPDADLLNTVNTWALPKSMEILGGHSDFWNHFSHKLSRLYPVLPRQIIHRDPNPGNIIRSDENWGFVDFELSERNARIYDPCYAATAILSETMDCNREKWPEILRNIIRGYDSVISLTPEEWESIPYIILANQLVCTAWFAEQAQYAELLQVNKQMTLWMIDHFDDLRVK